MKESSKLEKFVRKSIWKSALRIFGVFAVVCVFLGISAIGMLNRWYYGNENILREISGECVEITAVNHRGFRPGGYTRYVFHLEGEEFAITESGAKRLFDHPDSEISGFQTSFVGKELTVYYTQRNFFSPLYNYVAGMYDSETGLEYISIEETAERNKDGFRYTVTVFSVVLLVLFVLAVFLFISSLDSIPNVNLVLKRRYKRKRQREIKREISRKKNLKAKREKEKKRNS
ncbi:MAG: hypothetical protein IKK70_06640 [Clostridia bacterium]|nr:hypothetical protein [Clostridia bacterium]